MWQFIRQMIGEMLMTQTEALFKEFNKKYKEELFTVGTSIHNCSRIPFTSQRANYLLYGGIPRGRVTEFAGEEGSGKTTTALDVVGNAQKLFQSEWLEAVDSLQSLDKLTKEQSSILQSLNETGPKKVLWVDCERTFDDEWAIKLGVDVNNLYYMSPFSQSAEEIFEMVVQIISTGEIGLCVIDSLAMMLSKQEMEKTIEERTYGGISMALTRFSKDVELACAHTNCAFIGINQVRDNLNAGYNGPAFVTPGGKCWKHVCSVRLMFRKGTPFDEDFKDVKQSFENPYGHKVVINVAKTKICKPDRKLGFYTLTYDGGVCPLYDTIDLAITKDIIHKSGGWFTFIDPETGELLQETDEDGNTTDIKIQGQNNIMPFLQKEENKELKDRTTQLVNSIIYK